MQNEYHATPICHPDGKIDIAVRSPEGDVICTTLFITDKDVLPSVAKAFRTAELIAAAMNAFTREQS